jgi:hypothetical protein
MILRAMDQKLWVFEVSRRSLGSQETLKNNNLGWILRHMEFTREMLKDQLHLCKKNLRRCS